MIFDWTKYKRFFTFGCSFTCYMWPTWADIISKEMYEIKSNYENSTEKICLRPESTTSNMRAYIENNIDVLFNIDNDPDDI